MRLSQAGSREAGWFDCALHVTCVEPLSAQPLRFLVVDASCFTWSVEFPRLTRGPLLLASPYLLDGQHFYSTISSNFDMVGRCDHADVIMCVVCLIKYMFVVGSRCSEVLTSA